MGRVGPRDQPLGLGELAAVSTTCAKTQWYRSTTMLRNSGWRVTTERGAHAHTSRKTSHRLSSLGPIARDALCRSLTLRHLGDYVRRPRNYAAELGGCERQCIVIGWRRSCDALQLWLLPPDRVDVGRVYRRGLTLADRFGYLPVSVLISARTTPWISRNESRWRGDVAGSRIHSFSRPHSSQSRSRIMKRS